VKFVRLLSPVLAVMHSVVRMAFCGQTETAPSRDSMELTGVGRTEQSDQKFRMTSLLSVISISYAIGSSWVSSRFHRHLGDTPSSQLIVKDDF
jgi:hypothetical protein